MDVRGKEQDKLFSNGGLHGYLCNVVLSQIKDGDIQSRRLNVA